MVPTFFAISLIIFLILNVAPGRPGGQAMSVDQTESADTSGAQRESFRIFKEQFNLDKPILFNTRFALATSTVETYLDQTLNLRRDVPSRLIIKAQDELEDLGQYSVPHLVALIRKYNRELAPEWAQAFELRMKEKKRSRDGLDEMLNEAATPQERETIFGQYRALFLRDMAVRQLSANARRRIVSEYGRKLSEKEMLRNKEVDAENVQLKRWTYSPLTAESEKQAIITHWNAWYEKHKDRWSYAFGRKVSIFFLDTRFAKYWSNLSRLDFGISHVTKRPVFTEILSRLKYSLSLSVTALFIAYLVSVPLGIFSAVKQNSFGDRLLTVVLFMLYSLPSFFIGTLLLHFFSAGGDYLKIFPSGGFQDPNYMNLTTLAQIKDVIWHICLPIVCLTYGSFASLSRYARSGLLEVIRSDYIRTARAKGLPEHVVILKHAVRNGLIPILTLLGTVLPIVIGGSVIIEYIFGINGMGLYMINSIFLRDYNAVMAIQLITAILILIGMLISDISYALVDPRITFK